MDRLNAKLLTVIVVCFVSFMAAGYDFLKKPEGFVRDDVSSVVQKNMPVRQFSTISGQVHTMESLPEPVILLHFWASWCASCIIEFPQLLELVKKYQGRVGLVAVSIDADSLKMERFLDRLKKESGASWDDRHVYWVRENGKSGFPDMFNVSKVPETVFINTSRIMTEKMVGETDWLGKEVIDAIDILLVP